MTATLRFAAVHLPQVPAWRWTNLRCHRNIQRMIQAATVAMPLCLLRKASVLITIASLPTTKLQLKVWGACFSLLLCRAEPVLNAQRSAAAYLAK
jgi:hypothetical protein